MSSDVLALFDLDHTLLTLDSDEAWVEFLIEDGILDRAEFERANHELVARYRAGEATSVEFTHFYLSTLVGRDPDLLATWHATYLERKIRLAICPRAARQAPRRRPPVDHDDCDQPLSHRTDRARARPRESHRDRARNTGRVLYGQGRRHAEYARGQSDTARGLAWRARPRARRF